MNPEKELKLLRERLAKGEISEELFQKRRDDLAREMSSENAEGSSNKGAEGSAVEHVFCPECGNQLNPDALFFCQECEQVMCSTHKVADIPICTTCKEIAEHRIRDAFRSELKSLICVYHEPGSLSHMDFLAEVNKLREKYSLSRNEVVDESEKIQIANSDKDDDWELQICSSCDELYLDLLNSPFHTEQNKCEDCQNKDLKERTKKDKENLKKKQEEPEEERDDQQTKGQKLYERMKEAQEEKTDDPDH